MQKQEVLVQELEMEKQEKDEQVLKQVLQKMLFNSQVCEQSVVNTSGFALSEVGLFTGGWYRAGDAWT